MNDRDQARAELGNVLCGLIFGDPPDPRDLARSRGMIPSLLADPDLVRRALGMEPLLEHALTRTALGDRGVWVEPPTDQDSQESS